MARGWESKNVESQVEERDAARAQAKAAPERRSPTEIAANEQRRREREGLRLSRLRIVRQLELVDSPLRRQALESALAHLDRQIAERGE